MTNINPGGGAIPTGVGRGVGDAVAVEVGQGVELGVALGVGVVVSCEVGVGNDEVSGLNGETVEATGFELHATLISTTNDKITSSSRRIGHLIKRDLLLSLYKSLHPPARHNLHA